jgi:hypothetical protein
VNDGVLEIIEAAPGDLQRGAAIAAASADSPTARASPALRNSVVDATAARARNAGNEIMEASLRKQTNDAVDSTATRRSKLRAPERRAKATKEAERPMAPFGPLRLCHGHGGAAG